MNWILAKLDKYKIKLYREYKYDETSRELGRMKTPQEIVIEILERIGFKLAPVNISYNFYE